MAAALRALAAVLALVAVLGPGAAPGRGLVGAQQLVWWDAEDYTPKENACFAEIEGRESSLWKPCTERPRAR